MARNHEGPKTGGFCDGEHGGGLDQLLIASLDVSNASRHWYVVLFCSSAQVGNATDSKWVQSALVEIEHVKKRSGIDGSVAQEMCGMKKEKEKGGMS